MNHNPHGLKVGDIVMLDEYSATIVTMTNRKTFSKIRFNSGEEKCVKTNRLTPIK